MAGDRAIEAPEDAIDSLGELRLGGEQADHEIRLPRKIEEVSRMRQHAVFLAADPRRALPPIRSDGTSRTAYQPPSLVERAARGNRRDVFPKPPVIGRHPAGNLFADDRAPLQQFGGGDLHRRGHRRDTCRRRAPAARARHRPDRPDRRRRSTPASPAGAPPIFDSPPSENARTSRRSSTTASGRARARRQLVVGEHFVGDQRRARGLAQSAAMRSSSSAVTNEPVGLLGDTSRIARVRGVSAFSRESKSMRQPPSGSRS